MSLKYLFWHLQLQWRTITDASNIGLNSNWCGHADIMVSQILLFHSTLCKDGPWNALSHIQMIIPANWWKALSSPQDGGPTDLHNISRYPQLKLRPIGWYHLWACWILVGRGKSLKGQCHEIFYFGFFFKQLLLVLLDMFRQDLKIFQIF
jgi:hypothetical protein